MSEQPSVSESIDAAFNSVGISDAGEQTSESLAAGTIDKMQPIQKVGLSQDPVDQAKRADDEARAKVVDDALSGFEAEEGEHRWFKENRDQVDALENLFPGRDPLDGIKEFISINNLLQTNLDAGIEQIIRMFTSEGPHLPAKAKDQSKLNDYERALEQVEQRHRWKGAMQFFRENKMDIPTAIGVINHWVPELRADPVGAAAKIKAMFGGAVTEAQAQEQQQARAREQLETQIAERVIGPMSKNMPGYSDPVIQNRMAEIIETVPMHGRSEQEIVHTAYHIAMHEKAEAKLAEDRQRVSAKARLSITSGAPSSTGPSRVPGSAREALDDAFAQVGVR